MHGIDRSAISRFRGNSARPGPAARPSIAGRGKCADAANLGIFSTTKCDRHGMNHPLRLCPSERRPNDPPTAAFGLLQQRCQSGSWPICDWRNRPIAAGRERPLLAKKDQLGTSNF